ncbi:MAG: response regulator [Solirubrobacteraceae bacterium]
MIDIVLIEDNPADVEYTREVLGSWGVEHRLEVVMDGEEGLGRLLEGAAPQLVLLDLNLPRLSGTDILRTVRAHPERGDLPVVVLATSEAERDIIESERLEADGYLAKPISIDELEFTWFRIARKEHR